MAGLWYRAGTVTVTTGSAKITGFGSVWKSGANKPDKGHTFWGPDGKHYELDYVESDTVLYLVKPYTGPTASGQAYEIDTTRTSTIPALSREVSALLAYAQGQYDGWQSVLTGTGDVVLTAPDGQQVTVPSLANMLSKSGNLAGLLDKSIARENLGGNATNTQDGFMSKDDKIKLNNVEENSTSFECAPLPDVTIPFNINVSDTDGAGVINFSRASSATYINKNGQLVVVGQNVPRFEKNGLLIEGAVTNYTTGQLTNDSPQGDAIMSPLGRVVFRQGNTTYQTGIHPTLPAGTNLATVSVFVNPKDPNQRVRVNPYQIGASNTQCDFVCATGKVLIGGTDTAYANGGVQRIAGDWYRVWFMFYVTGGTLGVIPHFYPHQVSNPCAFDGVQVELLPIMTSYVPTNGAAATRAADLCTADISKTLPEGIEQDFTIAVEVDRLRTGPIGAAHVFRSVSSANEYVWVRRESGNSTILSSYITNTIEKDAQKKVGVVCVRCSPGKMFFRIDDKCISSDLSLKHADFSNFFIGNVPPEESFMHIRNFRIWHKGLTDTQIKGLR